MVLYSLGSRRFWGDFGDLLMNGMAARNKAVGLELRRTGPFAPPISVLNWLSTIVVTDSFRKQLITAAPFLSFRKVVLVHVPEFRWEHWDRSKGITF